MSNKSKPKTRRSKQSKTQRKVYLTYRFIDKDPIIDEVRDAVGKQRWGAVEAAAGVSSGLLTSWFTGGTKRPQFATVKAVVRAAGADLVVVQPDGATEIDQARVTRLFRGK